MQSTVGGGVKHTVENGTCEEHQELDEHVLFLGGDLVPAVLLASSLNIAVADALLDIGLEQVFWDLRGIL